MTLLVPIAAAVASAAVFGLSTSLQHREASQAPEGTIALVWHLLRQPFWLLGMTASVVALGLYALAVATGPLGLVQPILISGIVFALPIRAALDHTIPSRQSLSSAAMIAAGLALFLVVASPAATSNQPDRLTGLLFIAGGAPIAALLAHRGLRESGRTRGVLLGCAAGIALGLMAGALKMTVIGVAHPVELLGDWPVWAFVALAGWGTLLNQHAYREAPLSVSMPIVNILGPLIGIVFAGAVFGEAVNHRPLDVAVELLGLAGVVFGLLGLARAESQPLPDGQRESVPVR